MRKLGIAYYPKDSTDPKKKLIQLTDMCFPFSKQHADEIGSDPRGTPPLGLGDNEAHASI